jgi:hypothetical protein
MIDKDKIVVFDIETYLEIFLVIAYIPGGYTYQFEVSKYNNTLDNFVKFVEDHQDYYWVGYNNLRFDSQVIEWILRNYEHWYDISNLEVCAKIAQKAQDTINDSNYDIFPEYREYDLTLKQIDLFKIWHFDNRNRMVSLKRLEFEMDMENIEEMPIPFDKKDLTREECLDVIEYCKNDVWATYEFYLFTIGNTTHPIYEGKNKIVDREIIEEEIGLRCLNWSNVKIGSEWNKMDYMFLSKKKEADLKPQKINYFYGKKYKQFFPKTVEFQTKPVKEFVKKLGETFILNKTQEFKFDFSLLEKYIKNNT